MKTLQDDNQDVSKKGILQDKCHEDGRWKLSFEIGLHILVSRFRSPFAVAFK